MIPSFIYLFFIFIIHTPASDVEYFICVHNFSTLFMDVIITKSEYSNNKNAAGFAHKKLHIFVHEKLFEVSQNH